MRSEGDELELKRGENMKSAQADIHDEITIAVIKQFVKEKQDPVRFLHLFSHNEIKLIRYVKETSLNHELMTIVDQCENKPSILEPFIVSQSVSKFLSQGQQGVTGQYDIIEFDPMKKNLPHLYPHMISNLRPEGGLLILNVPEFGLISGNAYREKVEEVYGAIKMSHHSATVEAGIRLVLYYIDEVCRSLDRQMEVLLCTYHSKAKIFLYMTNTKKTSDYANNHTNTKLCGYCSQCDFYETDSNRQTCPNCCIDLLDCGKLWVGPLTNKLLVQEIILTQKDLSPLAYDELVAIWHELDYPLSFDPRKLLKKRPMLKLNMICKEIEKHGCEATRTRFNTKNIKTNCNFDQLIQIFQ